MAFFKPHNDISNSTNTLIGEQFQQVLIKKRHYKFKSAIGACEGDVSFIIKTEH
jgi:hypothetical protein